jgi:hypothetical protein
MREAAKAGDHITVPAGEVGGTRIGDLNTLDPHNKARSVGPGHLSACFVLGNSRDRFQIRWLSVLGGAAGAGTWGWAVNGARNGNRAFSTQQPPARNVRDPS